MTAHGDQRHGVAVLRSRPTPLVSPAMRSSIPLPTKRDLAYEQRGERRGFKRGAALGLLVGFFTGGAIALFVVAIWRAVATVIGMPQ